MAIVASNLYSGRITTDDTGYPLGKAQDIINGEKGTGTPLRASWVNDQWGFLQALLDAANISPSGTPDQVGQSDYLDAVNKLIREPLALKIFQSPSSEGLTEIQTRTVDAGEVYEVRKTSDGEFATIYSNAAGTTEIAQDGTNNVSDSDGVVEFYIADGDYYVEVGGVVKSFDTHSPKSRVVDATLDDAVSENAPVGSKYNITDLGMARYEVVASSDSGGFYIATLASGNKLKYIIGMMQTPEHFGATGNPIDVIDETTAIQSFFQFYKFGVLTSGKVYGVSSTLNLTSNSELHGSGEIRQLSTSGNVILGNGVSNTKILGGKIKGNITTQISGYSSNCVFFQLSDNIKVSGLICETTEFTTGVKLANTTNFIVEGAYVYGDGSFDVSALGTSAFDGVAIIDGSRDGVVTKCNIKNVGIGVSIQSIASDAPIYNVKISYCNIQDMSAYGIMSYRLGSVIQDVDIVHNYVKNIYGSFYNTATSSYTHGAGIYLQTVDKHRVNFNTVYNVCINTDSETLSPAGISCAYTNFAGDFGVECEFIGNYIDGSTKYGMLIDGIDHTVTDNKIMNTTRGHFYSRGSENLKLSKLTTKSIDAYTGILLAKSNQIGAHKNITIEDVTLKNPATGISADGIEGGRFDKVKVLASTAETFFNGITTTSNTSGLVIDGATIEANGAYGIRLQGGGNKILNSNVTGAGTSQGIVISKLVENWVDNSYTDNFPVNNNPLEGMVSTASSEITLPWYAKHIKLKVNTTGTINSITNFPSGSVLTMYLPAGTTVSHLGGGGGFQFSFVDGLDRVTTRDSVLTFDVYFTGILTCTSEAL